MKELDNAFSNLEDETVDRAAKYLGLKLDRNMRELLRSVVSMALPAVRDKAESLAVKGTGVLFKSKSPEKAEDIASKIVGYTIATLPQIVSLGQFVKDSCKTVYQLRGKVKQLPEGAAKENFVITELRAHTYGGIKYNLYDTLLGFGDAIPQVYLKYSEDRLKELRRPLDNHVKKINGIEAGEEIEEYLLDSGYKGIVGRYKSNKLTDEEAYLKKDIFKYVKEDDTFGPWNTILRRGGTAAGSLFSALVQRIVGTSGKKHHPDKNLYEMITELSAEIRKSVDDDKSADSVRFQGNRMKLEDAIASLFEETHKRRYPAGGELPPGRLRKACELIADAMRGDREGRLDPMALIELVGRKDIVLNKEGEIAEPSHIEIALEKLMMSYNKSKPISAETYYRDTGLNADDIKALFEMSADEKDEQAILATVLPIKAVMQATGMSRGEISELHKYAEEELYNSLVEDVKGLASSPDEELAGYGLGKEEIHQIRAGAQMLEKGGSRVIDNVLGSPKKPGLENTLLKARVGGADVLKGRPAAFSEREENKPRKKKEHLRSSRPENEESYESAITKERTDSYGPHYRQ